MMKEEMSKTLESLAELTRAEWLPSEEMELWDSFVQQHANGIVYQTSKWRKILETAFPHIRGRVGVLRNAISGQIQAGLPLYTVSRWLLGKRLVSIPYASVCDPLIASAGEFTQLWRLVLDGYQAEHAKVIEIRARKTLPLLTGSPLSFTKPFKHHLIPLQADPERVFETFSRAAIRRMIAKARHAGVRVERRDSESDLRCFYALFTLTRRRLCLPSFPYAFFGAMEKTITRGPGRLK
jgi:hypothetical protein